MYYNVIRFLTCDNFEGAHCYVCIDAFYETHSKEVYDVANEIALMYRGRDS